MEHKEGNKVNPKKTEMFFKQNFAYYHDFLYFFMMRFNTEKFYVKIKNKQQVLVYLDELKADAIIFYITLN